MRHGPPAPMLATDDEFEAAHVFQKPLALLSFFSAGERVRRVVTLVGTFGSRDVQKAGEVGLFGQDGRDDLLGGGDPEGRTALHELGFLVVGQPRLHALAVRIQDHMIGDQVVGGVERLAGFEGFDIGVVVVVAGKKSEVVDLADSLGRSITVPEQARDAIGMEVPGHLRRAAPEVGGPEQTGDVGIVAGFLFERNKQPLFPGPITIGLRQSNVAATVDETVAQLARVGEGAAGPEPDDLGRGELATGGGVGFAFEHGIVGGLEDQDVAETLLQVANAGPGHVERAARLEPGSGERVGVERVEVAVGVVGHGIRAGGGVEHQWGQGPQRVDRESQIDGLEVDFEVGGALRQAQVDQDPADPVLGSKLGIEHQTVGESADGGGRKAFVGGHLPGISAAFVENREVRSALTHPRERQPQGVVLNSPGGAFLLDVGGAGRSGWNAGGAEGQKEETGDCDHDPIRLHVRTSHSDSRCLAAGLAALIMRAMSRRGCWFELLNLRGSDMSRSCLIAASLLLLAQLVGIPTAQADPQGLQPLEIGATAPDFKLPGVDGRTYSLADFQDAKVLVVVFTCNHCPTAQAYEPRLKQFVEDYRGKGVAVVAISPNDDQAVRLDELGYTDLSDSFAEMKIRAKDHGFNFPYLYDGETQATALAYGCLATPHVFIFDAERKLRYQGRFDDQEVKEPTSHDAINAVDALWRASRCPWRQRGCSAARPSGPTSARARRSPLAKWDAEPVKVEPIDVAGIQKLAANQTDEIWS